MLPAADALGHLALPIILRAQPAATGLALRWPLSGAGLALMTATNLTPPARWWSVTNTVLDTKAAFDAALPIDAGQGRFFQLRGE